MRKVTGKRAGAKARKKRASAMALIMLCGVVGLGLALSRGGYNTSRDSPNIHELGYRGTGG